MIATTVRTFVRRLHSSSLGLLALIAACAAMLTTAPAGAVSSSVRNACMSDYFSYCAGLEVDSKELRRCMNKAGPKLSSGCVQALVSAGEISQAEVNRRAGKVAKAGKQTRVASASKRMRTTCDAGPARPGAKASACRGGTYAQSNRVRRQLATLR